VNPEIVRVIGSLPGGGNIVTGHSLGGALAQICATHYADRFGRVVTFQAPGISQAMVDSFNQREQRPRVTHHIAAVDAVDRAGQEHLPGATYMHHTTQNDFTVPTLDIPVYATPILQAIPGVSGVNVRVQLERVWNFIYGIMNGHMRRMLVSSQMSDKYRQVGMNGNWGYPHQIYGEGAMPTNQSNPIVRYDRYPQARENTSYEIDRRLTGVLARVLARIGDVVVDAFQSARQAFEWFIDEMLRSMREGIEGGLDFWRGVFTF
jgi:pimeloyl-ACP methyl ester carboxylesterase